MKLLAVIDTNVIVSGLLTKNNESPTRIILDSVLPDPDDLVFYETYVSCENSYLITGNKKHFPSEGTIISPSEMVQILYQLEQHTKGMLSEPECLYLSDKKKGFLTKALETIERIRKASVENGTADMTMEEIDEEIRKYRRG